MVIDKYYITLEFAMKINQIVQETTTSGSVAPVEHGFVKMQTRSPSVYGNTKAGSLFKGKKTKAPYANSINESAELSEADLQEDDIILVPGQGRKMKTGFVPHGKSRVDHEVEMARSDLLSAAKNAEAIFNLIETTSEDEGLQGWVQEKIIKANDYLNSVREYLEGQEYQTEGLPPAGVIGNGAMGESSQRVDSLVTDALKIMRGPELADAVQALKTVLGDREFSSRRGHYNFFIRQMMDMYRQQGVAEGKIDFAKKIQKNIDKSNKAVVKTKKEVGSRIADIGPGGKEYNVKTDKAWDDAHKVKEGAKVDRMVKHIEKSEKKLGKSKDEAENIAWATANKRGMLDNKNKKK